MKLAQCWYDDPDAQHARAIANGQDALSDGTISNREFDIVRREANRCRDYAKRVNRERG